MASSSVRFILLSTVICLLISGSYAVDSLRLFIIGDMGGIDKEPYTTLYERSTAAEMGKLADVYGPQHIIEIGDNFYYEGVKNVKDFRFNITWEQVYTAKSLQVPWHLVAGNHDHNGNASAQIAYSKVSERWNMPSFWYYLEFPVDSGHKVGFVMIDTVLLCGMTHDHSEEQPHGPLDQTYADEQWDFIQTQLSQSKADYLFTVGHYPIYSIAEHGPTRCLVDRLQPMLEKYSANGHLCGHDHNLQHLQVNSAKTGGVIDYFVSGMANFIDNRTTHAKSVPHNSLKFHTADVNTKGGFLYSETTAQNMTMTFIGANGDKLYKTIVKPRKL